MAYRDTGVRQLTDLREQEHRAFAALVRLMVRLGGEPGPSLQAQLEELATELGEELFWDGIDDSEEDDEGTERLARQVKRRGARELIFGTLYQVAIPGSIVPAQAALLDWLTEIWSL